MPEHADIARAIVVNDGEVLILQNVEDDPSEHARGRWEAPGGFVEAHDDHEEAAVAREVAEETGLDVEVVRPLERIAVTLDGDTSDCQYYLARADSRDVELSDEHRAARWIRPGEARDIDWYYYSTYMIPVLERLAAENVLD
ncbi:MAG: NUDIX hydrolase [Candidatus Nanohaloarchaea archaeon]|nr:NUDIX hydrolase [Candidatus Nanohaloarchaea archaeon]